MLFPLFIVALLAACLGIICAVAGYDLYNGHFVRSPGAYFLNIAAMLIRYTLPGTAFVLLYARLFGWPVPE